MVTSANTFTVCAERNCTPPTRSKLPVADRLSPRRTGANRVAFGDGCPGRFVDGQNGSPAPVTAFAPFATLGMHGGYPVANAKV